MITPEYVRLMANYNGEMNRRFYEAAGRLDDDRRIEPAGVFWGSLAGTFAHLLWADQMWMSRLAGWPKPAARLADSGHYDGLFADLTAARLQLDRDLIAWSEGVDADWLAGDLAWFSGAAGCDLVRPRAEITLHMFNHQTHHRGQAHALLTAAGETTGDTDLFLVVP